MLAVGIAIGTLLVALPAAVAGPLPSAGSICAQPMADSDWMLVADEQTPARLVHAVSYEELQPRRTRCVEAVFSDSGLDTVTESQWTLVLAVVVGADGRVERFRVVRKAPVPVDTTGPLLEALRQWRFRASKGGGARAATCCVLELSKPLGRNASEACGSDR